MKTDTIEELIAKLNDCEYNFCDIQIIEAKNGDWIAVCQRHIQDPSGVSEAPGTPEKEASQSLAPSTPESQGASAPIPNGLPQPANPNPSVRPAVPQQPDPNALSDKQKWRLDKMGYTKEQIAGITKQEAIEIITAASTSA